MKKWILLLVVALTATVQVSAQEPTALWGKAIQSGYQSNCNKIQVSPDGGLYAIASVGTHEETDDICLGSDKIAPGTKNYGANSNSINKNLIVTRLTADGNAVWTLHSKNADVDNNMLLQPVADGIIVFFDVRHADKCGGSDIVFVDATNHETVMSWTLDGGNDGKRYYQGVVMKISHEGVVQWLRQIDVDHQTTAQGIYAYLLSVDKEGNIFIGGNYRAELTLLKSDKTNVKIPARYVDGWNGDTQTSVGDLILVKLDKDGYYQKHLQTSGSAQYVSFRSMDKKGDKFYLMGSLKGTANEPVYLGDKQATPTSDYMTFFTAAVNSSLDVDFFTLYAVEGRNFTINCPRILAGSNCLWFLCKAAGIVNTKNGKTLTYGSNTNVGMVMKIDAENGELLDGYVNNVNQAGYFSGFEGSDGKLYAVGYTMFAPLYCHFFTFDNLNEPAGKWENMIANTSNGLDISITEQGILYTSTTSNQTANKLYGGVKTISQTSTAYTCNLCAFQLPVTPVSSVRTIAADGLQGDGPFYDLRGIRVEHPGKGLYISGGKKVIVK